MDKATLLLAAGNTLRRSFAAGFIAAIPATLSAARLIGMLLCSTATMMILPLCAGMAILAIPLHADHHMDGVWLASYFAAGALPYAALSLWAIKDGSFAIANATASTRMAALIFCPWVSCLHAMDGLAHETHFPTAFRKMAKLALLALSLQIQAFALACALCVGFWRAFAAALAKLSGAGAALERLAAASPEIIAAREAGALDRSSDKGEPGRPSTRL